MRTTTVKVGSLLLMALLVGLPGFGATVRVKLVDRAGAGFPEVLVIMKSLEGKGETFRYLTDTAGTVPTRDLTAGLYRIIATCPYGICETKVSEVLVGDQSVDLSVVLDFKRAINVVSIGSEQLTIQVVDAQGMAAPSTPVLVRDSNALHERWYKTNASGEVPAEIPSEGAITIVVVQGGRLIERVLDRSILEKTISSNGKLVIRID